MSESDSEAPWTIGPDAGGSGASDPHAGGPAGPPPPQPVDTWRGISQVFSSAILQVLDTRYATPFTGSILTYLPQELLRPYHSLTRLVVSIRPMRPHEYNHPLILEAEEMEETTGTTTVPTEGGGSTMVSGPRPPARHHRRISLAREQRMEAEGRTRMTSAEERLIGEIMEPELDETASRPDTGEEAEEMAENEGRASSKATPKPRATGSRKLLCLIRQHDKVDLFTKDAGETLAGTKKAHIKPIYVPRTRQSPKLDGHYIRVCTWNAGGLTRPTFQEIETWVRDQAIDVMFIQETKWAEEYCWDNKDYTYIHSAGTQKVDKVGGVLTMISSKLAKSSEVQFQSRLFSNDYTNVWQAYPDATPVAKQAKVLAEFPVAGWREGAKHYPVLALVPVQKPRWNAAQSSPFKRLDLTAVLEDLRQARPPPRLQAFQQEVDHKIQSSESFDQTVLQAALQHYPPPARPATPPTQPAELANSARHMWQLFRQMRSHKFTMHGVVQAWKLWVRFSRAHAIHKRRANARVKARRDDLLQKAPQAADTGNMYEIWGVVKQLAPRTRYKKVQLHKHGVIMAPEAELAWIAQAFGERFGEQYSAKPTALLRQHTPVQLDVQEVNQALRHIPARKAVPPGAIPAAFWKVEVQQSWANADVALLPKGKKQVSLDLTAAFDLVNWGHLRTALALAQIEPSTQELLLQWLRQVVYVFHHKGGRTEVRPAWGLRQGCPASPFLRAVFTALLNQAFDQRLHSRWAAEHVVMYADDSHLRWTFDTYAGFERAITELRLILRIFAQFDMKINFQKTQALLLTTGTAKSKILKHYIRHHSEGRRLLLSPSDPTNWLPLVTQAEYLGLIISYERFEALSTRHRISKAHQRRWALASILHSRKLAKPYKLHIWRSCVQTTMLYGLQCLGLSQQLMHELQVASMKHIRAIVSDQQHLTGHTHQEIMCKFNIDSMMTQLQKAHARELQLQKHHDWMQQYKWNQHITRSFASLSEPTVPEESDKEQDTWACPLCDSLFSTAAALKIHAQRILNMAGFAEPDQEMAQFFGTVGKPKVFSMPEGPAGMHPKRRREAATHRPNWQGWDQDEWEHQGRYPSRRPSSSSSRDPLLLSVARLALRHEEELKLLQQDTNMVLWFSPGPNSVLPHLYQTAVAFKKRQQEEPTWGLAHVPLKQVMATALFRELRERHHKVLNTPELLKTAVDMGWKDNQGWVFQTWNPQLRHLERDNTRPPIPDTEMSNKLEFFITHLKRDVVHRFHCTRKLTETMDSKATFHLDLSVRNKHAEEIWDQMVALQGCCVFQLIGLGYRRERMLRLWGKALPSFKILAIPDSQWICYRGPGKLDGLPHMMVQLAALIMGRGLKLWCNTWWIIGIKIMIALLVKLSSRVQIPIFTTDRLDRSQDDEKYWSCDDNRPALLEKKPPFVAEVRQVGEVKATSPRLSVVITTSPIPSHPSTMLLEAVIASFTRVQGLADCPLIIVCDGFKVVKKTTWKAGKVTEEKAANYAEYKAALKRLQDEGRLPSGTKLVILEGHNGQAFAVKAALAEVETPLVCIHQHDLEFTFDFDLERVLDVLADPAAGVKYVGLPLLVNLHYEGIAYQHHGVRVKPEMHRGLSLMPIIFWYDSTHITSVEHYTALVFGPEEAYNPGNFVEETFGVRQRNDIMAKGMEAHAKYGTYHCISTASDGTRRPLICHLNGVRFLTPEQRAAMGYPADPPVEFYPSRTMMSRKQRKVRHILDAVLELADVDIDVSSTVRNILSKLLNETHLARGRVFKKKNKKGTSLFGSRIPSAETLAHVATVLLSTTHQDELLAIETKPADYSYRLSSSETCLASYKQKLTRVLPQDGAAAPRELLREATKLELDDSLEELRRMIKRTRSNMDCQMKVLDGFISDVNHLKGNARNFEGDSRPALPPSFEAQRPALKASASSAALTAGSESRIVPKRSTALPALGHSASAPSIGTAGLLSLRNMAPLTMPQRRAPPGAGPLNKVGRRAMGAATPSQRDLR
ncbi:unnamed protein product [Symbiodinium sp. KB8]|nr:unnamed protein product [Symbiodinium sp. KB8]